MKNEKEILLNSEKRALDEVHSLSERVHRLQVVATSFDCYPHNYVLVWSHKISCDAYFFCMLSCGSRSLHDYLLHFSWWVFIVVHFNAL